MNGQQKMNLELPQILQAARAGLTLLNTPGAVSVPSQMAITGDVQILNALLTAIVQQQVMVVNAPPLPVQPEDAGDDELKPELKAVGEEE